MSGAAMPKAAIHENGEAPALEDKVWFTRKELVASPTSDFVGAKNANKLQFCGAVSGGTNSGHDLRTLFLGEYIRHSMSPL